MKTLTERTKETFIGVLTDSKEFTKQERDFFVDALFGEEK